MNFSLTTDFNQLKSLITRCGTEEKAEIVRMSEKDTFPFRFNQLLSRIRTDDLTLEEITGEAESVRQTAANPSLKRTGGLRRADAESDFGFKVSLPFNSALCR